MKSLLLIIALFFSFGAIASNIPSSINMVKTFRCEDNLIRVIKHNMEINPELEVEMFSIPNYKLVDKVIIDRVNVDGSKLGFDDVSGVFIESIELIDSNLNIVFDYYFLRGGREIIICNLPINKEYLGVPLCRFSEIGE